MPFVRWWLSPSLDAPVSPIILIYILRKKAKIWDPSLYAYISFPSFSLYSFVFAWEHNGGAVISLYPYFLSLLRLLFFILLQENFNHMLKSMPARETNFLIMSVSKSKLNCKSQKKWIPFPQLILPKEVVTFRIASPTIFFAFFFFVSLQFYFFDATSYLYCIFMLQIDLKNSILSVSFASN